MAFLFRLPGDSAGVIVQYRPFWKISSLHLPATRTISVYGTENLDVKVPHTLLVQTMPDDMLESDLARFRAGVKYQIYELSPDFSALNATALRFGNVAVDGGICWGRGNTIPYDLREASRTYWGAPFNGDLTEDVLRDVLIAPDYALDCYRKFSKAKPMDVDAYFKNMADDIAKFPTPAEKKITQVPSQEEAIAEAKMLGTIAQSWEEYLYITSVFHALNSTTYLPKGVAVYHTVVGNVYNLLSRRMMTAVSQVETARMALNDLKNELAYNDECRCLDCEAARRDNASRIAAANKTVMDLETHFAPYIGVNKQMSLLAEIPNVINNKMRNAINERRLIAHLKNYRTPGEMVDLTADLLGSSHIAINQRADAVFITAVPEEIAKFDEKQIRMRGGVRIIIGLCRYIGDGKYVVDAGGSAVVYEPAAKKDKITPFDPAILVKKDDKPVEAVNEAATVAALV